MPGLITLFVECVACGDEVPRTAASQWSWPSGPRWVCDGCWAECDTCGNRVPACTVVDDYYGTWDDPHPGGTRWYCSPCTMADLESVDSPHLYLVRPSTHG